MRGVYVRTKSVVKDRLSAGLAAPYVDDFTTWLRKRRYTEKTIVEWIRKLASWTHWACLGGYRLDTIREAYAVSLALIQAGHQSRFRGDINKDVVETGKLFISYLMDQGILPRLPKKPEPLIVTEFTVWAREQQGLVETTLGTYRGAILPFVAALGDDATKYDASAIRQYMLGRAGTVSISRLKGINVAVRAFLRFLIASGKCPTGLDYAMPGAAGWRHTSSPRFLAEADITRVIIACDGERRLRDRAIILLLVRLGLRASEAAGLRISDIDWRQGNIRIQGKGRREERLPLTQEVGDALLAYIERARPRIAVPALFITEHAPLQPIDRIVVKCLVDRALKRSGVASPHKGAHILRHSAATAMLKHGVSLTGVGAVLRHRSPSMSAHYAKVDFALLADIAQPWVGRLPC